LPSRGSNRPHQPKRGKTLEFKRDLSSPELVLKAIVAFANTSGGVVLLGVEDGTKRIKGIRDVLTEEERLASLMADAISPKLVPSMEVMPWRKTQALAVEIYPIPSQPHYLNRDDRRLRRSWVAGPSVRRDRNAFSSDALRSTPSRAGDRRARPGYSRWACREFRWRTFHVSAS
jgi:ATP-dependent DNA helicase RecG